MTEAMRRITISLPEELVEFADERADKLSVSRSKIIVMALSQAKSQSEEQLAAEGYRFYAEESSQFASASDESVAEAWSDAWLPSSEEGSENAREAR